MDKIILSIIFLILGISLYHNKQRAAAKYDKARKKAVLSSMETSKKHVNWTEKLMTVIIGLIILCLVAGLFVSSTQKLVLLLILAFLVVYYFSIYNIKEEWFFDQQGLWSRQQTMPIGFENIVAYEWREYGEKQLLRVRYKGRGIMLISSDYMVRPEQKEAVTKLISTQMAGM